MELTEIEILILRALDAKPALDIPGGIVDDNMSELIDSTNSAPIANDSLTTNCWIVVRWALIPRPDRCCR